MFGLLFVCCFFWTQIHLAFFLGVLHHDLLVILLHLLSRLGFFLRFPFGEDLWLWHKITFGVPIFNERTFYIFLFLLIILGLFRLFCLCFGWSVFARLLGSFILLSECFFLGLGDVRDEIYIYLFILIVAP